MGVGEYEWPEEFKDEDKWVYLTKRQWLIVGIGVFIDFLWIGLFILLKLTFLLPVVFIPAVVILAAAFVIAVFPVPDNWYLYGSGLNIEVVLFRLLKKKRKKEKVIYTKHYDNNFREW